MPKTKIVDAVSNGRILISDGAWGTYLQKMGLLAGECPELWSVERFDEVKCIAASYVEAGSDMVETNSFGANRFKLEHYGLADRVGEINEQAARASREAAGDDHWVIASVGPTGKMLVIEEVTEEELYEAFREQAMALEKGGADAVCIETMSDIGEAVQAIRAAKENTDLEVICTFTFEKTKQGTYRTMMGVSPADATRAAIEAGVDIAGANCGNGMERMVEVVREIREAFSDIPILVHANAGLPENIDGVDVFPETPEEMAGRVGEMIDAGANIVGGCCGTTPGHIRAMKQAAANHKNQ
jgi:5-methyltetrahydrofolate--homocysteine methyltransferase